ncbi:MAG: hypothetical protein R2725_07680 [Solirubrobacterales bacterium]
MQPRLLALTFADVLSWLVTYRGELVDVTLSTHPGGVLFDGPAVLRNVEDKRPGRDSALLRLDLDGFGVYVNEATVSDPILETGSDAIWLGLPGNVALELRPL